MNYYELGSSSDIWVSSTGLKEFEKSPRGFLYWLDAEKKSTPAMEFGTTLHRWFESPSDFIIADFDKPTEQLCEWVENVYEATKEISSPDIIKEVILNLCNYKSLKDEAKILAKFEEGRQYFNYLKNSEGKTALTQKDKTVLEGIVKSYKEKFYWDDNSEREKEIFWEEETEFGIVKCKAKIDELTIYPDSEFCHLVDFKSTAGGAYVTLEQLKEWKYVRQLAFYNRGLIANGYKPASLTIIMCSKQAPFDVVGHFFLGVGDIIKEENEKITKLLREVAWCLNNGFTYSMEEKHYGRIKHD